MLTWTKSYVSIKTDGSKTISYLCMDNPRLRVESRTRPIPHASGNTTWLHTSYFVMLDGEDIKETWRLKEAKEYAESLDLEVDL